MITTRNHPAVRSWEGLVNQLFQDVERHVQPVVRHAHPSTNIVETADAYHLELLAPGRQKELFDLKVDNEILTISYKANQEAEKPELKYARREFHIRDFSRSFNLEEKVEAEGIQAKYENGVLKLLLPKKASTKPATRQIAIS